MAGDGDPCRGADQPARRDFAIASLETDGGPVPVETRERAATAFVSLVEFARADGIARPPILMVPPLSGHFPVLMRDVVLGLLQDFRVSVLDWTNVRHVPPAEGLFGFDDNIAAVREAILTLGPGVGVVALCQAGVPALAAVAGLSAARPGRAPAALALVAAPVDPLANPTRVVRMIRRMPPGWFRTVPLARVGSRHAGRGRWVYPAETQLAALDRFLERQCAEGGELARKLRADDGADPERFPFMDLYTSVMDIDATHYVGNIRTVFLSRALMVGRLDWRGQRIDPRAIGGTALMTVEGGRDEIVAPGQTSAAHALCTGLAPHRHRRLVVPGSGHFSLFHGETWRGRVLPAIRRHCLDALGGA